MNIVEVRGSDIPKIFREEKEYCLREPELIDMGSDFRINLYWKDAATDLNGVIDPKASGTNGTKVGTNGTGTEHKTDVNDKAIMQVIQDNPKITQKDIRKNWDSLENNKVHHERTSKSRETAARENQQKRLVGSHRPEGVKQHGRNEYQTDHRPA